MKAEETTPTSETTEGKITEGATTEGVATHTAPETMEPATDETVETTTPAIEAETSTETVDETNLDEADEEDESVAEDDGKEPVKKPKELTKEEKVKMKALLKKYKGLETNANPLSVQEVVTRYEDGRLIIPEFQREMSWDIKKMSHFIQSMIEGVAMQSVQIGVPQIKDEEGDWTDDKAIIIDGQHRIITLFHFIKTGVLDNGKEFILQGPNVDEELKGFTFETLPKELKDRLLGYMVPVITTKTRDHNILRKTFTLLNMSTKKLTAQELRTAAYFGNFTRMIQQEAPLAQEFVDVMGKMSKDRSSQNALRYFAFRDMRNEYGEFKTTAKFLDEYCARNVKTSKKDVAKMLTEFKDTMRLIKDTIGKQFFSKNSKYLLGNAYIFETLAPLVSENKDALAEGKTKDEVIEAVSAVLFYVMTALRENAEFVELVEKGGSKSSSVKGRFEIAEKVFTEAIEKFEKGELAKYEPTPVDETNVIKDKKPAAPATGAKRGSKKPTGSQRVSGKEGADLTPKEEDKKPTGTTVSVKPDEAKDNKAPEEKPKGAGVAVKAKDEDEKDAKDKADAPPQEATRITTEL